jgi:preprotein translocase subunit SecE
MTNQRWVAIGYVVLALLAGTFLEHLLAAVFGLTTVTQPLTTPRFGSDSWTYSSIIGLAIGVGAAIYLWRRQDTHDVSMEIAAELRKVTWPSLVETRAATIAVIVASLIAAALLGLFDVFWQFVTDKLQNPSL